MKPHRALVAFAATTLIAGCAAKPENILPAPVSQARFSNMSCEDLETELLVVTQRLNNASERQRRNRTRDGLLNALVIPGLGAVTSDQEETIAQAKGEIEAIERAFTRCDTSQSD